MSGTVSYSFSLNLSVLKLVGIYPSKKYPILQRIYAVSLFALSMTIPLVFGTLHFAFTEDLTANSYNEFVLIAIMFYGIKLSTFLNNGGEIQRCIEYFDNYVVIYSDHQWILEECIFVCKRNSLVFLVGCLVSVAGFIASAFVDKKVEKLPVNVWLPHAWRETPLINSCVYFLLTLSEVYIAVVCGTIDPLIGGLSLHASTQLQILGRCLQFLDHDGNENSRHNIHKQVKMCIQQYQIIVNFVDKYQHCFSPMVFIQFIGSVLIIGLCCFQLSVMKFDIKFLATASCFGILFFEIFFYCYYGTLLIEENDAVSRAIYMSRWYEYDEQSKKALLLLMTRLQKSLFVTAGKLLVLSLETFTLILKRSYSLLAVLRNY